MQFLKLITFVVIIQNIKSADLPDSENKEKIEEGREVSYSANEHGKANKRLAKVLLRELKNDKTKLKKKDLNKSKESLKEDHLDPLDLSVGFNFWMAWDDNKNELDPDYLMRHLIARYPEIDPQKDAKPITKGKL